MTSLIPPNDPRFFQADLKQIPEPFSDLLEKYSGIPRDQQIEHILRVRNKAYAVKQYPCLGRFRFLDLNLAQHPLYHSYILPTLTPVDDEDSAAAAADQEDERDENEQKKLKEYALEKGPIFLDLSSCLSQDTRKLCHDGVPASRLYASDLEPAFTQLGYDLFRDENVLSAEQFLAPANVLLYHHSSSSPSPSSLSVTKDENTSEEKDELKKLDGKIDILNATAIFHLFDLDQQETIARRCLKLLRGSDSNFDANASTKNSEGENEPRVEPKNKKKLIVGGQASNITASESTHASSGRKMYRHNLDSWREMWERICFDSASEWKDRIKSVDVQGELLGYQYLPQSVQQQTSTTEEKREKEGEERGDRYENGEGDGIKQWNSMVVGRYEDGFRWHVFWVWVEFW